MEEEEKLQAQLEERKKQEEILWRQKSRVQWLKEGEKTPNSSTATWSTDAS